MDAGQRLLDRLDAIGQSVAGTGAGLAVLGLGSVGAELDRLDAFSDLDFFVIVGPGCKAAFIDDLGWLSAVCPVVFSFKNTGDGYKLLFEDGIFCEFAVFEEAELGEIPFAGGRLVWKAPEVDEDIRVPRRQNRVETQASSDWLVGEALTNLLVGLGRYHRGERLSAVRFVQGYAVDRVIELSGMFEVEQPAHRDPFAQERRYEQRFPELAGELPRFMQGYERTVESAREILEFLARHVEVNTALKAAILALCDKHLAAR